MTDNDNPLAYLVALQNHKWRIPLHRRVLGKVRRVLRCKQSTITVDWFGEPIEYSRTTDDWPFYPYPRDFRDAIRDRRPKHLALLIVCWLRGHDMPWQVCVRCQTFIP